MANAGECDPEIYKNGTSVGLIVGGNAHVIEAYIKFIAEETGQPVDWHYFAGRGNILTTGDVSKVKQALQDNLLKISIDN